MLPTSHQAPIYLGPGLPSAAKGEALLLADAFSEFITASAALERSYRELQVEVSQLSTELAAQNAALAASLCENEQMRLALLELVDSMPCGILVLGPRSEILRINPEATRLLALAQQTTPVSHLHEIAHRTGLDLQPFCAIEGESEICLPDRCSPDGTAGLPAVSRRWIAMRARRLSGAPSGAQTILILTDISTHKQAEQDREAGRRALALAEIAATLAHEIRNPLASMELFVALLQDDPARTPEWIEHLRAGLRGLAGTVHNVLSFHNSSLPPMQPLLLGATIASAAKFARPLAEQAGLRLTFEGSDLPGCVLANEGSLQQILLNLVANAVRHTAPGGRLAVGLHESGPGKLTLSFADTGCGIATEHLPRIFEAGWSATGDRSGLGLAVCQTLAAQHGATLHVTSTLGQGTCFHMEWTLL